MEKILTVSREEIAKFVDISGNGVTAITMRSGIKTRWKPRQQAETDETVLQFIPYLLVTNENNLFWSYSRIGGDKRLRQSYSCGVGGHVEMQDDRGELPLTLLAALQREVHEELVQTIDLQGLQQLAWIYEADSAIGRVHLGCLYHLQWPLQEMPQIQDEAMRANGFVNPTDIQRPQYEFWSELAVKWLHEELLPRQ